MGREMTLRILAPYKISSSSTTPLKVVFTLACSKPNTQPSELTESTTSQYTKHEEDKYLEGIGKFTNLFF